MRWTKHFIGLLTLVLVACLTLNFPSRGEPAKAATSQPGQENTFELKELSFRLKAPASWNELNANAPGAHLQLRQEPPEGSDALPSLLNVIVVGNKLKDEALSGAVNGVRKSAKRESPNGTFSENQETKLGGSVAVKFTFTTTLGGKDAKVLKIATIHRGRLYLLAVYADAKRFDEVLPSAQKIIDSFEWVD